jgi:hypothetical protein
MINGISKRLQSMLKTIEIVLIFILFLALCNNSRATDPPFAIKNGLFDHTQPDNLGLTTAEGTETITIFRPDSLTDHFSNGVVMTFFKGYFYCQWQSSAKDEDAQDTWVAYSRSQDGKNWTAPMTLAPTIDGGFRSSGGWWVTEDTLVAYINVWPADVSPRGGYASYTTSIDGLTWSEIKPLLMANGDTLKGIFEQDPHALPDGRIISAAHFQPGLIVSPVYTDDPSGIRGWIRADFSNLSISGNISREIEPSWFLNSEDTIVMTFRDQNSSYRRLASVSGDRGESWSTAVLTDMPDSRSKQSAGNIGDSTAFMVGNPADNKTRIPLAVTLSRDGKFFNTAYVLRQGGEDLQELIYAGQAKRAGYHYPKSMIWQDYLYVSYSTNKEDVEYTRVPLASLILDTSTTYIYSPSLSEVPEVFTLYQNYPNPFNPVTTIHYQLPKAAKVELEIYTTLGQKIATLVNKEQKAGYYDTNFNASQFASGVYLYSLKAGKYHAVKKMIILK